MADEATKAQQIEIAELVRADRGGFGAWPSCSRSLRLPDWSRATPCQRRVWS